ncbi:MAG: DUF2442 domain-containing protein [Acidobacteria bacterium]|nr:MAG: DUF2442 domain-containing protein [Acidobacteriota bacterium]
MTQAESFDKYRLSLTFDDGVAGIVDLSDLAGKGIFAFWLDPGVFENVWIGSSGEAGVGIDTAPGKTRTARYAPGTETGCRPLRWAAKRNLKGIRQSGPGLPDHLSQRECVWSRRRCRRVISLPFASKTKSLSGGPAGMRLE